MAAAATAARDGQTALALRLAKHLAPPAAVAEGSATAAAAANKNVAFSPVSVHAALALTAAGARGAMLAQLLAFLGAPMAEELAEFGRRVADRVLADRSGAGGPRVLFGGGVWVDAASGGLTDAFSDVAAEAYKSNARTVSFTEERGCLVGCVVTCQPSSVAAELVSVNLSAEEEYIQALSELQELWRRNVDGAYQRLSECRRGRGALRSGGGQESASGPDRAQHGRLRPWA